MINNELLYKNEVWHENGIRAVEEFRSSYQSYMNHDSQLTDASGLETFQVSLTEWNELGLEVKSSYINKPYNFVYNVGTIFQYGKLTKYFDNGQIEQEKNLIETFTDENVYEEDRHLPSKCWISEGLQTDWYENGQMHEQGSFKGNKPNGVWETWSENGHKKYNRNFTHGELETITHFSYYENGDHKSEIKLNADNENHGKQIAWHENGQKSKEGFYEGGLQEGQWIEWHENGQKITEDFYQADYKYGKSTTWYSDGQKWEEIYYKKHAFHGTYILWHENGQKAKASNYKEGYLDGESCYWYENGQIESKLNYKPDPLYFLDDQWSEERQNLSMHGIQEDWYENGQKMRELKFKNGQLDGFQVVWDENGEKLEESVYKDGVCLSGDCPNSDISG